MIDYMKDAIQTSSWNVAICTFAFFTIKGLLWLIVPLLVVRARNWYVRAN